MAGNGLGMNFVQFLSEALKSRISRDMGPDRFPPTGWDQIPLGTYYFSTDGQASLIVIHRVVGEVLHHSLAAFGMMILPDAWRRFFESISVSTTPAVAVERMRDAASTAIPLPHTMALGDLASTPVSAIAEGTRRRRRPAKRTRNRK